MAVVNNPENNRNQIKMNLSNSNSSKEAPIEKSKKLSPDPQSWQKPKVLKKSLNRAEVEDPEEES